MSRTVLLSFRWQLSDAECKRLGAKVKFVNSELESARSAAAGERTQAEIDVQTKAEHAELLRKVEQINVLTDSNRLLRQEKDSMQPRISELTDEVVGQPVTAVSFILGHPNTDRGQSTGCTKSFFEIMSPSLSGSCLYV